MKNASGYTLIELLVSISIIGLVFTLGFVSFREFSRRQALIGVTKTIRSDLRLAQAQASSGEKPASCGTSLLDGYNFAVKSTTSYAVEAVCGANVFSNKAVSLPADFTISTPSPNPILFKVLGQGTNIPSGTTVTITVTQVSSGKQLPVTVSYGGKIK